MIAVSKDCNRVTARAVVYPSEEIPLRLALGLGIRIDRYLLHFEKVA